MSTGAPGVSMFLCFLSETLPRNVFAISTYVCMIFFHFVFTSHSLLGSARVAKQFFRSNTNSRFGNFNLAILRCFLLSLSREF